MPLPPPISPMPAGRPWCKWCQIHLAESSMQPLCPVCLDGQSDDAA